MRWLLLAAVLAGVVLRCEGLGRRPLWYDEAATLLHLSGRSESELRVWYDGRSVRRTEVLGRPSSVAAVVAAAQRDEPQSGPGYFAAAAVWQRLVGATPPAVRALSALASVLAIGAVYRVAHRLFGSTEAAGTVAALAALSPLHLRYAAEARPYALWSLTLLLWVLATLRAHERSSVFAWSAAGCALVAALAVHPLTLLVVPAVAALGGGRRFWASSGMAVSTWTVASLAAWSQGTRMAETTAWVGESTTFVARVRAGLGIVTSLFVRPGGEGGLLGPEIPVPVATVVWLLLGLTAIVLVVAGLSELAPTLSRGRAFVRRLALVPWGALALLDLAWGGRRSAVARYLVPSWLGAELAVGGWIASARPRRSVLVALLALGAVTAIRTHSVAFWWDTDAPRLREVARVAAAVNAVPGVVIVTDLAPTALVELVTQCHDDVELRLGAAAPATIAAAEWERVRVVFPSAALLAAVRRVAEPAHALVALGAQGTLFALADRAP